MQRKILFGSLLTLSFVVACSSNTPNTPTTPSISISPTILSARPGDTASTFVATLNNSSGTVSWTLTPSGTASGTLSSTSGTTVQYTPPASVTGSLLVQLTAAIDNTPYTATADITVSNGPNNATGTLAITVTTNVAGLDAGLVDAGILVTGPNYSKSVAGTSTLKVVPGPYTVTASNSFLNDPIVGTLFSALVTPAGPVTVGSTGTTSVAVALSERPETGRLWIPGSAGAVGLGLAQLRPSDGGTTLTQDLVVDGADFINALAFDSSGKLWVTDNNTHEVRGYSFNADGGVTAPIVIGGFTFTPYTLSFGPSGDMYVGSYVDGKVLRFSSSQLLDSGTPAPTGVFTFTNSAPADAGTRHSIANPDDTVVDRNGALWVLNGNGAGNTTANNSIAKFNADGGLASFIVDDASPLSLEDPSGVSFDTAGNLWVGGWESGNIVKLNVAALPAGTVKLSSILLGQLASGSLKHNIQNLTFDNSGNLWVYSVNGTLDLVANPNALLDAGTYAPTKSFTGGPSQNPGPSPGRLQFNPPVPGIGLYP